MATPFKSRLSVSRERLEFIYSILVLIIIPVLIIANTIWLTGVVRNNFDIELRRKADLASSALGASITSDTDNETLQNAVDKLTSDREEIVSVTLLKQSDVNKDFEVVATNTPTQVVNDLQRNQYSLVQTTNRSIATLTTTDDGTRVWSVVSPITENDQIIALSRLDVSLGAADTLISGLLNRSLVILSIIVIVVMLLLFNHFKFVEYAQLFKKLKEADQLKDDFLSVATHELKAPMSAIRGYISNVLDETFGPIDQKVRDSLEVAMGQTDRLGNLVKDLLNVSRIEQGRINVENLPVELSGIIGPIVERYSDRADEKQMQIDYQQLEGDVTVVGDAGRLEEVFTNLIDNAVKYSLKGSVTITHKIEKNRIVTTVRDTGIGMTAEERERLFQRFYRVKNDATKTISGTGLGLWIIKQYIEKMNGSISVDSLKDVGTEFSVELVRSH